MIRKPHSLQCRAVTETETKLPFIKKAFSSMYVYLWTIFRMIFSNNLPVVDKRLVGRKFWILAGFR
jgi:hypothetical protein